MISRNLVKLRTAKGLTQEKLSELSGVSRVQIVMFERGTRCPTVYTALDITKALECTLNDLIEE